MLGDAELTICCCPLVETWPMLACFCSKQDDGCTITHELSVSSARSWLTAALLTVAGFAVEAVAANKGDVVAGRLPMSVSVITCSPLGGVCGRSCEGACNQSTAPCNSSKGTDKKVRATLPNWQPEAQGKKQAKHEVRIGRLFLQCMAVTLSCEFKPGNMIVTVIVVI